MIKITKNIEKEIENFLKEAVIVLAKYDIAAFIDKFDSSCVKQSEIYMILRYGNQKQKPVYIDVPYEMTYTDALKIIQTQYGCMAYFDLFTYGMKNGITLEIQFITDCDMFYVILENISFCQWHKIVKQKKKRI